jgi:hypothetical protein
LRSLASAEDTARVFSAVKPRLAVVYHYRDEDGLADAIAADYKRPFVIARDLTRIVIDRTVSWNIGSLSGSTQ